MWIIYIYLSTQNLFLITDEEGDKGQLIIACSSDRGLCGAVHSSIGRIIKADLAANPNSKVVIIGDKVRNILQR